MMWVVDVFEQTRSWNPNAQSQSVNQMSAKRMQPQGNDIQARLVPLSAWWCIISLRSACGSCVMLHLCAWFV